MNLIKQINFGYPYLSANLKVGKLGLQEFNYLVIMQASTSEDGVYFPPSSVSIAGKAALMALRDALIEAYPLEQSE